MKKIRKNFLCRAVVAVLLSSLLYMSNAWSMWIRVTNDTGHQLHVYSNMSPTPSGICNWWTVQSGVTVPVGAKDFDAVAFGVNNAKHSPGDTVMIIQVDDLVDATAGATVTIQYKGIGCGELGIHCGPVSGSADFQTGGGMTGIATWNGTTLHLKLGSKWTWTGGNSNLEGSINNTLGCNAG